MPVHVPRELLEPLAQRGPLLPANSVLPGRKIEVGQPAGPALGQTVRLDQVRDHRTLAGRPHHFRPSTVAAN